jgi:sulfate adenylyltransferase large subunit
METQLGGLTKDRIDLLRFSTAGSVDDGKSTLIGRLLYDSKLVFEDQLEALRRSSDLTGGGKINLANLTDGLRAEREQGITIDVAYRYFSTGKRKFIVADTPGHVQYTRNMVTGASTAHAALVLIDARQGVIEQTRRHAYISSLLRVPHLVVCVNKMDLVDYSAEVFGQIRADFSALSRNLKFRGIHFVPISALNGDNVVDASARMPWYKGPTLLRHLEELDVSDEGLGDFRFPVQYILRPTGTTEFHDFRGFAGRIAGGMCKVGDAVTILPSGKTSRITQIHTHDGDLQMAHAPMSVSLLLEDDIDISRGDMLVHPEKPPRLGNDFHAMICWMSEQPMQRGAKYGIKHLTKTTRCMIPQVKHLVDVRTLSPVETAEPLKLNDIARVSLKTMLPLAFDEYATNRGTGGFVLIDEATNATVAAGMICA